MFAIVVVGRLCLTLNILQVGANCDTTGTSISTVVPEKDYFLPEHGDGSEFLQCPVDEVCLSDEITGEWSCADEYTGVALLLFFLFLPFFLTSLFFNREICVAPLYSI